MASEEDPPPLIVRHRSPRGRAPDPDPAPKKKKVAEPTVEDFMKLGRDMMHRSEKMMGAPESEDRRFREMFGVCPVVALMDWNLMCAAGLLPEGGTMMHWLWTLCFLKVYAKQGPLSVLCGEADPKTIHKWVWEFIRAWIVLEGELIVWENRKRGDKGNDCLVSCDGTDFKIAEHGSTFSSHKFAKKSGLRYEICLCILTGDIVWINGPCPCGKCPDITIFCESLMSFFEDGERVESDDGFMGEHPKHTKCPRGFTNPQETELMQQRVRNRQETVNNRFKNWGILVSGTGMRHLITGKSPGLLSCSRS